jgi:hypothetical protein
MTEKPDFFDRVQPHVTALGVKQPTSFIFGDFGIVS